MFTAGKTSVTIALASLFGLTAGCASETAAYRPVQAGPRHGGRAPTSYYRIVVGDQDLGSVKLWSLGGRQERKGSKPGVLDIKLRVQNNSDESMTVDLSRSDVQLYLDDKTVVTIHEPLGETREVVIPSHGVERFRVSYALPTDVKLPGIEGFDFDWTLETNRGLYSQATAFERDPGDVDHPVFWPVYGPGWWGYPYGYPFIYGTQLGFGLSMNVYPHSYHRHRH